MAGKWPGDAEGDLLSCWKALQAPLLESSGEVFSLCCEGSVAYKEVYVMRGCGVNLGQSRGKDSKKEVLAGEQSKEE